jgi:RHS repeat-associated protein
MAIAQVFAYDAYGNAIGFSTGEALTEFLYSGEQFDSKIGQQYLRARYYDPATGRFNRLDPFFGNLGDPQSLHMYLYTHADPINGIDPSGEVFLPILLLAMGIGGVGGFFFGGANAVYGVWTDQMDITTGYRTWFYYTMRGLTYGATTAGVGIFAATSWTFFGIALAVGGISGASMYFGNADNFLAELPYFSLPSIVTYIMADKIKKEAHEHDLPPELVSSVLMAEMYQYHIGDALGDDEVFSGNYRSIGIAQLRIDNVRAWCKSSIGLSDKEIRNKLYTWDGSIEFLAEAMAYWRDNTNSNIPEARPTRIQWIFYGQSQKELSAAIYTTAKDSDIEGLSGAPHEAGIRYGGYSLRQTQFMMEYLAIF